MRRGLPSSSWIVASVINVFLSASNNAIVQLSTSRSAPAFCTIFCSVSINSCDSPSIGGGLFSIEVEILVVMDILPPERNSTMHFRYYCWHHTLISSKQGKINY